MTQSPSTMASMVLLVLILAMATSSDGGWCVCRSDVSSSALQKTLDYACGAGADCGPILQNGPCYNPNTVISHCSYAANSYYQRRGQAQQACDFSGTAQISQADPSPAGCTFPASPSAAGTSGTTTNPSSSTTTGGGSTFNPNSPTGVLGLGPSGTGLDGNQAASLRPNSNLGCFSLILTFLLMSALALMRA